MFKRLFFAMVGLGGGVALGVMGVRKLERTQKALAPSALAGSIGARVSAALDAGRAAMAQTEAQLRAEHGIGGAGKGLGSATGQAYAPRPAASQLPPD